MIRHLLATLFLFFTATALFAQQKEQPLVQFSGIVHNADSAGVVVPYVTITNLTDHGRQDLANYQGYFSFVAHERDTLRFTCVGYAPQTVVIPHNLNKRYIVQVDMKPQITNLPTFRVFPWATTDEFKKDFLSMKRADDDIEIARKNLSRGSIEAMAKTLPRSANEIQSGYAQNEHLNILNQHSLMPNPLFNPIAWGTLIKQIAAGDKSRENGN